MKGHTTAKITEELVYKLCLQGQLQINDSRERKTDATVVSEEQPSL
jgi:hypothetical protein